jgi:cellulose synthase/poly-beta-1,6-N-acetylglucosamine synthase-like glycosyltransferase
MKDIAAVGSQLKLGEVLVEQGLLSPADLQRALDVQSRTHDRLGRILMSLDLIRRRQLYPVLADTWGLPFIDLLAEPPDYDLVRQFESQVMMTERFVPMKIVRRNRQRPFCAVATSDLPDEAQVKVVQELLGDDMDVRFLVTTDWDIDQTLADVFREDLIVEATTGLFERSPEESAYRTFYPWQRRSLAVIGIFILLGLLVIPTITLVGVSALVNGWFFCAILFKCVVSIAGMRVGFLEAVSDDEVRALQDADLPIYTVLVPVYKEARIVSKLIENLGALDWPASKLEILLLMEEDDDETLAAARAANPPETVTFVVVPDSQPRTKPRACNVGMFFAKGKYLVIYDAEDKPDTDQLKKAYVAFQKGSNDLVCVQAALNYFNRSQNLLTRMFTLEYSYWFDYMLHGLARLGLPIPLGGTSNHFRVDYLRELGGWDPYNVTEDADLGIRAAARGYKVGVINSTTYEEANSRVGNWIRQRSRWIKGYMQTTLVYTRNPLRFIRSVGLKDGLGFALLVGGTPLTFLFTLPAWGLFVAWLVIGLPLDDLYPGTLLYVGLANLILGNVLMVAVNALGVTRRRNYDLLVFALANPVYWMLHSVAAYKAAWQLVTRPFYWEKTDHGLAGEAEAELAPVYAAPAPQPGRLGATGTLMQARPVSSLRPARPARIEEVAAIVPAAEPMTALHIVPLPASDATTVTPRWAHEGATWSLRDDASKAYATLAQLVRRRRGQAESSQIEDVSREDATVEPATGVVIPLRRPRVNGDEQDEKVA